MAEVGGVRCVCMRVFLYVCVCEGGAYELQCPGVTGGTNPALSSGIVRCETA